MPADNPNPLAWIDAALADLERNDLRRHRATRTSAQSAQVTIDGRDLINFGSNDYLGLASDKRLAAAAQAAAEREGWGGGASPLVSGRSQSHAELERRLAEFEDAEAALVFPSGFAANAGIIPAIVDDGDAIFADAKNHASLIDGCRLSNATRFVYPHCGCDALEMMLRDAHKFRRRLIVTDTLFSMDGDLAPLARLAELAARHNTMLLLDEAHATGVFGPHARGLADQLESTIALAAPGFAEGSHTALSSTIRIGTLSKALGSAGGFVCGPQPLIDWLANRARTYVFSTAQPPASSAAAIAALDIVQSEPHRRQELLSRSADLRGRLRSQGWNTGRSESQIIPLILGDPKRTLDLATKLRDAGYFIPAIRPPTVPDGESLLRLSLCYHHTPELIDALTADLAKLR
ncbi:MAG TPA: 8-amino-7-oxononanoate synthase [Lacipirellulaceae bacterium]|jgi:8-amino-7-oxononanoate synthase|nr:8-amino-7-oxononanoate synthase [Lacipirellulaceae bacterium]